MQGEERAMKILLTTLNSKHIHSSLALRYLKTYCKDTFSNLILREFTINQKPDYILEEIYRGNYQIVCFSCYIWNITMTLQLIADLKKVSPHLLIVLGGPEVSFNPIELMETNKNIDYIVLGEGEVTFKELLNYLIKGEGKLENIAGLAYRQGEEIKITGPRAPITDLGQLPFPYEEGLAGLEDKIIYYESSRGCPFNCSYCLSSTLQGVRFFPLERVKKDLLFFLNARVNQVKFVDRTFNANKNHSLEIMRFIHAHDNGHTNFHFEITADLLDQEMLDFLAQVRKGLFQFEIGVQTTNPASLAAIRRPVSFEKLKTVVKKLASFGNIHLHLDLIAGLPYEDFASFRQSFNDVYNLKPEKIQLGFLKLLKGTPLREEKADHGYIYKSLPPYEVQANNYISFEEILRLKRIEDLLERYYNSSSFTHSLDYLLLNFYAEPFDFYQDLSEYWEAKGYQHMAHSKTQLYAFLLDFYTSKNFPRWEVFAELLKLDFLIHNRSPLPSFFLDLDMKNYKNKIRQFLEVEKNIAEYLPDYLGWPAKEIIKKVHFQLFKYDLTEIIRSPKQTDLVEQPTVILFDYGPDSKKISKARFFQVNLA